MTQTCDKSPMLRAACGARRARCRFRIYEALALTGTSGAAIARQLGLQRASVSKVISGKLAVRPQLGRFRHQCEYVVFASKGRFTPPSQGNLPGVYAYHSSKGERLHLTSKPVALIQDLLAVTAEDAMVLDPFMGGGSVGEACLATGRGYIGIELSADYFGISRARLQKCLEEPGPHAARQ